MKMRMVIRKQNKTISSMEEELEKLRNTPQISAEVESSIDS